MKKSISGTITIETGRTDIGALTSRVVKDNQSYASAKSVTFDYCEPEIPLFANVQEQRFEQVLRNLLSNAAKYSEPDSVVKISIRSEDGMVAVCVTDFGEGIPEEFKTKLFEPFTQYDSSQSRKHAGLGLGLSICRSLIEGMGGKIHFESE